MKQKNIVKIIIPCLILLVIGGIYFFKNPPAQNQEPENIITLEDTAFVLTATETIDFEALSQYGLPIIVDYGSDSCIPCQQMAPVLAGVLTSFTPCSLSSIPLVIGYVGGTGMEPKKAFRLSLVFAAGSAVTFTILGTLASLAGRLVGTSASWWYLSLGVLMVLMALQTWEIFNFIPSTYLLSKSTRRGYAGALIAGILGGVFSSPCATPVLIALLAIVAGKGSVAWGMRECQIICVIAGFFATSEQTYTLYFTLSSQLRHSLQTEKSLLTSHPP